MTWLTVKNSKSLALAICLCHLYSVSSTSLTFHNLLRLHGGARAQVNSATQAVTTTDNTATATTSAGSTSTSSSNPKPLSPEAKALLRKARRKNKSFIRLVREAFINTDGVAPHLAQLMEMPVFQVTTRTGNSYLTHEQVSNFYEQQTDTFNERTDHFDPFASFMSHSLEHLQFAAYYTDYEDAVSAHADMAQYYEMDPDNIRVSVSSLGKALRSGSNLASGLLTGNPAKKSTGKLPDPAQGGVLRHKLSPSWRQLYYACRGNLTVDHPSPRFGAGRDRVGLMHRTASLQAKYAIREYPFLLPPDVKMNWIPFLRPLRNWMAGVNLMPLTEYNKHMIQYTGIPVFYAPEMEFRPRFIGQWVGASSRPRIYMNYEDLQKDWTNMKLREEKRRLAYQKRHPKENLEPLNIPDLPRIQVFNLWDLITSADREASILAECRDTLPGLAKGIMEAIIPTKSPKRISLKTVQFVPCSRGMEMQFEVSRRGSLKPRLKPMQ